MAVLQEQGRAAGAPQHNKKNKNQQIQFSLLINYKWTHI